MQNFKRSTILLNCFAHLSHNYLSGFCEYFMATKLKTNQTTLKTINFIYIVDIIDIVDKTDIEVLKFTSEQF